LSALIFNVTGSSENLVLVLRMTSPCL